MLLGALLTIAIIATFLVPPASCWWQEKSKELTLNINDEAATFSPSALLSTGRSLSSSEFYTVAISKLETLRDKPSCYRQAAQILMSNCQSLEQRPSSTSSTNSNDKRSTDGWDRQLADQTDSYAASLAVCDLEKASADIPRSCAPFRTEALVLMGREAVKNGGITREMINRCVKGLYDDPRQWTSFQSNRKDATIFCRAARIDIEKDDAIKLGKQVAEVMNQYARSMEETLDTLRQDLAEQKSVIDSHTASLAEQLELFVAGSVKSWNLVTSTNDILKDMLRNTKQFFDQSSKVKAAFDDVLKTSRDSQVQILAQQEQHLELYNSLSSDARSDLELVLIHIGSLAQHVTNMTGQMNAIVLQSEDLKQHQAEIDERFDDAITKVNYISVKMEELPSRIDTALNSANLSLRLLQMASYIASPFLFIWLGSYGLPPSLLRNMFLGLLGLSFAIAITNITFLCSLLNMTTIAHVSSFTQRPKEFIAFAIPTRTMNISNSVLP